MSFSLSEPYQVLGLACPHEHLTAIGGRGLAQYCSSSAKAESSSNTSTTVLGSKPGALSLRDNPISASLAFTSSIDFEPKLRMSSRSCSLRDSSSPTVWMPSRLRQL